jgi:hypothetical protein
MNPMSPSLSNVEYQVRAKSPPGREDPRIDDLLADLEKACRSSGRHRSGNGVPQ